MWITRLGEHHPVTSNLHPVPLSTCMHILFSFTREESKKTRIFYRCLAANNFPSGHPREPYIFTYGKLGLDFMGWIVLGFCEKRRSKNLTVCGKTEQPREREMFWSDNFPVVTWKTVPRWQLWAVFLTHIKMLNCYKREGSILWCEFPGDSQQHFSKECPTQT